MSGLSDSNKVTGNDETIIVIADGETGSGLQAGVTSEYRLKVDNKNSFINRTDVSTTETASGASETFDSEGFGMISSFVNVTAVSGTNPTLDIMIDASDDGSNWFAFQSFKRFTATGNDRFQGTRLSGRYYRYSWTVSGSTPSFTFSIISTLKAYKGDAFSFINRYSDVASNTLNATSTTFSPGDRKNISISTVRADDGGSNCSYRIEASNDGVNWNEISGSITQARATTVLTSFTSIAFRHLRLKITSAANAQSTPLNIFWGSNS